MCYICLAVTDSLMEEAWLLSGCGIGWGLVIVPDYPSLSAHILVEVARLVVSHFHGESLRVKGSDQEYCRQGICSLLLETVCEPFGCLGCQHESSRVLQECHGRTL